MKILYLLTIFILVTLSSKYNGACTDSQDHEVIFGKYTPKELYSDMHSCGMKCITDESCIQNCVEKMGITANCAYCYAKVMTCTASNCWSKCILSGCSNKCYHCMDEHCAAGLKNCTGIDSPRYHC